MGGWFLLLFIAVYFAILFYNMHIVYDFFPEKRSNLLFEVGSAFPILNIFYAIYLTYKLCKLKQSLIKSYLPKFRGE